MILYTPFMCCKSGLFSSNFSDLNFLSGLEDLGHLHPNSTSDQLPTCVPRRNFVHEPRSYLLNAFGGRSFSSDV
jgi:hypothetical protein